MTQRKATYLLGTPTGSPNKQDVTVTAATTASATNGLKLTDYRFKDDGEKTTIFGTLATSAAINVYIYPFPGDTTTKHLEVVISAASDTYNATTGTFSEVLNGPFWGIEVVKADGTGSAKAIAYL